MHRSLFLLLFLAAGARADDLWRDTSADQIQAGERLLFPSAFRLVTLDVPAFQRLSAAGAFTLTLPMPDGSLARFAVEESPIMEPDLAAQLPDIKTYKAQGIDDPAATARLDFTPAGFHGFVLSPAGNVYIDPYQRGDVDHYMSYWRRDYPWPEGIPRFHCDTEQRASAAAPLSSIGATLRTYRLALACTGEYAAFYGGTVAGAQSGMVTTVNRINAIYEREIGVRLVMVNNAPIVFTNASTDPYSNTSSDLGANQSSIDANIGPANYDVGHLFGTGGGGVAAVGVVCVNGVKAQGLTGSGSPVGDAFDVDYVAHELGHQFGALHSFNGTTSACGGGSRTGADAYEPGSGSTIMAYAGICGAEDLQPHSDPYFHTRSFDEIVAFLAGTGCAVQTSTGNAPPAVSAGAAITVPAATPFYLTGSGSDPDGDALTWCWEELDLGTFAPPNTDNGNRPIFRSFNPAASPVRTFPRLADLLSNTATFGESLPTTSRTMTFRLTARDNRSGGGGVNYATTSVSVSSSAGPFTVTSPNAAVTWAGGSTQPVTWNVAGTTAVPVSCANVKILLSTDGGSTYPTTIVASTPNDGSEPITVPNVQATTARIRVECVTSPFFDISNVNFSIAFGLNVVATALSPTSVAISWTSVPGAATYEVYRRGSGGGYSFVGSTAMTLFSDDTAAPGTAYLYAVRSLDGSGTPSPLSSPDLATTVIFSDPTLTPHSTMARAVHVTELRTAVNAVRALAGLGAYTFIDPALTSLAFTPKAAHIGELRTALDAARAALGLSAATYADPTLIAQSTVMKVAHVEDLRNGVR